MKKTLVIHPSDRSTDFLKLIYKGKDWDVINDLRDCSDLKGKRKLIKKMEDYDRIIMMGHGTPQGLMNIYDGHFYGFAIDSNFVDVLSRKENISIWCWSDQFFRRYNLKGFHTGMIISEVREASFAIGKTPLNEEETLKNMEAFATIVGECIDGTPYEMKDYILEHYNFTDDVTKYNRGNILVLD